jgi:hypothetical protein
VLGGGGVCQSTILIEIYALYSLHDCLPSVSHLSSLCLLLIIRVLHLFLSVSLVFSHCSLSVSGAMYR